jgi:hypothetical protein
MSNKDFKLKNGLVVSSLSTAGVVTTDSSGNIGSSGTLAILNGGTGQTTAQNARNALLPLQTGSEGYFLSTDQTNVSWAKVYNQLFKNAGTSVNPRKNVNIVGAVFADDSETDTTTITFTDVVGVSKSGGDTITASGSTVKGLIVKGAASQTADLQQWQDSTGTVKTGITSSGQLYTTQRMTIGLSGISSLGELVVSTADAARIGVVVQGVTSQTANLQEWQNSAGTVLANIPASGGLRVNSAFGGAQAAITAGSASTTGAVIRGAASQSASLMEWQNSAGTVLTSVRSDGRLWAGTTTEGFATLQAKTYTAGALAASFEGITSGTSAVVYIKSIGAAESGLLVRGAASQSANLQEWQNSAGTVLAAIEPSGSFYGSSITAYGILTSNSSFRVNNASAGTVAAIVKGAASQTANLQEWQSSAGTVYATMSPFGQLSIGSSPTIYNNARISLNTVATTVVGMVIRGVASQTADLQQWQNSTGTAIAKIDSTGAMFTITPASGTNTTQVATTEFVSTAVNNLIDSAPGTLNTLNEIAAALNDDPNFSSTITTLNTALSSQDTYSLMGVF